MEPEEERAAAELRRIVAEADKLAAEAGKLESGGAPDTAQAHTQVTVATASTLQTSPVHCATKLTMVSTETRQARTDQSLGPL